MLALTLVMVPEGAKMKVTTVLLDVDGTLVDSNDAHAHSWREAMTEFGFQADFTTIREKIGMGGDKLLPLVTGVETESELGKKITELRAKIFKEKYLPTLTAFPRTRNLLEHMLANGFRLVVATSASKEDLTNILTQAKLSDLLNNRVTSDDAENSKPDPDILQAALKKMKRTAGESIMVGDTPYDIEAATRAGIRSIGLTCGGWTADSLKGAEIIFANPADFLQSFLKSPLAN